MVSSLSLSRATLTAESQGFSQSLLPLSLPKFKPPPFPPSQPGPQTPGLEPALLSHIDNLPFSEALSTGVLWYCCLSLSLTTLFAAGDACA